MHGKMSSDGNGLWWVDSVTGVYWRSAEMQDCRVASHHSTNTLYGLR
jgi:hypothetical protein